LAHWPITVGFVATEAENLGDSDTPIRRTPREATSGARVPVSGGRRRRVPNPRTTPYGWVVDSVNVSVLLYVPVRSASLEPMCWPNVIATGSLETGPLYASTCVGLDDPPTAAAAEPVPAGLVASAVSGEGSENAPLTRWPVAVLLGSATDSAALPAVEITLAVVAAL
jgi:hypothetical protein